MKINDIFRYSKSYSHEDEIIDNLPNYSNITYSDNCTCPTLEKGINQIASVKCTDGDRIPAILIAASPHKAGSDGTPWLNYFDVDNGHIQYYGDNKITSKNVDFPEQCDGNKNLLNAFKTHSSPNSNTRKHSIPIIFFKRVTVDGRSKGNVMFQGFGIIERVQLVTQKAPNTEKYFSNYVFDFVVLDMSKESENFNWEWITDRRNANLSLEETLRNAPDAWKQWLKSGPSSIEKYRRRVSINQIYKQKYPKDLAKEELKVLEKIYNHYKDNRYLFEGLAAKVTEKILNKSNNRSYIHGWITPGSRDGGGDFIGRLDLGSGFSTLKLVVLGQAKCEKISTPTNGNHIARTVARLKRGWIGVYVTTSYFSEPVQVEIIEDSYPILLINGKRLVQEVIAMSIEQGYNINNIIDFLNTIDADYESKISRRRPEEILLFNSTIK